MKKLFLLLFLLMSATGFAQTLYYVNPDCSSSCDGSSWANGWDDFASIDWNAIDNQNSVLYLSGDSGGRTYSAESLNIIHDTLTYTLEVRPGSYSASPSGHDGLVTLTNLIKLGDELANEVHLTTISGETSSGSGTRNLLISISGTGMAFQNRYSSNEQNKLLYVEITGAGDGVSASGYVVDGFNEVGYNYIHDNYGHTDIFPRGGGGSYGSCLIYNNTIEAGTINYISQPSGCDVYNNVFDADDAIQPYDLIHWYIPSGGSYVRIWNNHFSTVDQGIFIENSGGASCDPGPCTTEKIRIFNNTFASDTSNFGKPIMLENDGVGDDRPLDDVWIFNNVFYDTNYSIRYYGSGDQTYTNFYVKNNIFYESGGTTDGGGIGWDNASDAEFDYNILYDGVYIKWQDDVGAMTVYNDLATFETDQPAYTDNIADNPDFVSSTNYRLQSGSPAINTGEDLSAVSNMPAGWPFDKDGVSRTGDWEIGAYLFAGGDTTDPTVVITSPTSDATYATGSTPINLGGTAADDVAVSTVTWACPECTPTSGSATGTTTWTIASIGLASGSNVITVTATDSSTNTGTDVLTVTYTPSPPGNASSGLKMRGN